MRMSKRLRNVVSSGWARVKFLVLASFARLLDVHLGLWRDLQNLGFWVVASERPTGTRQLAAHLYPGEGTDIYFPAPEEPEILWVEPSDMPPGPRSLGRACYHRPLVEGLRRVWDAARRLHAHDRLAHA